MSYKFSKRSLDRLETCHPDIQLICKEVIKIYDFSVLGGLRTLATQQEYFNAKPPKTSLDGITNKSKHQGRKIPKELQNPHNLCYDEQGRVIVDEDGDPIWSMAVDIMPWKKGTNAFSGNEKDDRRFYMLMGMVKAVAARLKAEGEITHDVRFGLDWDGDDTFRDQKFDDLPHFELI